MAPISPRLIALVLVAISMNINEGRSAFGAAPEAGPPSIENAVCGVQTSAPPETPATIAGHALNQAVERYRRDPKSEALQDVAKAFRQLLVQPGIPALSTGAIIKAFPVLHELGAKAIDCGSVKIWLFTKVAGVQMHTIQWAEVHQQISLLGNRRRKQVTTSVSWHTQPLSLPNDVLVKEAKLLTSQDGNRLILAGEQQSSLWIQAYRCNEGVWIPSESVIDSIPPFLRQNVSGKLQFRGADLILTVAQTVSGKPGSLISQPVPEAESSTYRFLLRMAGGYYVVEQRLPDEEQFGVVKRFLEAVMSGRSDLAKSQLVDSRLTVITRYTAINSMNPSSWRVAQLATTPTGITRFRLITSAKNDLIFDVARIKGELAIKAIFISPPDPWVQQISQLLPAYEHFSANPQKVEPRAETTTNTTPHLKH